MLSLAPRRGLKTIYIRLAAPAPPMREKCVTSQGSAQARFQRAIGNGHVGHAEIAARELGRLQLAGALAYTVLLVRARDPRALRAAHRWVQRVRLRSRCRRPTR
jgi:hypothetical protein